MSGSNNNNSKSDVGFILFLILVVAVMIPFFIGFDNFNKLIQISKIIVIVFSIIAVIASSVFGYIYFKKKSSKRKNKINIENEDSALVEPNRERDPKGKIIQKIDLKSINQEGNFKDARSKLAETDSINNDLLKINQKYDF